MEKVCTPESVFTLLAVRNLSILTKLSMEKSTMKILKKTAPCAALGNSQTPPSDAPAPLTVNEWLTAYLEVVADKEEQVPKGYLPRGELAKKMGCGIATASERGNVLYRAGRADRIELRRLIGGRIRIVPYFKLHC